MTNWQRWKGIMKAYPFEEKRLAKWEPPYIVNIKYDGDRGVDQPLPNGNHIILSSEENPIFSVPHINKALAELNLPLKLDGEFYNHDLYLEGGHELIRSIISRTVNIHPRFNEMNFHIFDYQESISQMERVIQLSKLNERIKPPLVLAPYWVCYTLSEIKDVYDRIIKMEYEGIIVRNAYASYEIDKRSRWVMKFKPKKKDVYKIVGWREEVSKDGIPKDRIGSLIFSSQEGDEFAVSAGLNDESRAYLWDIKESLEGMVAVVHYQHLTDKKIPKGTFDLEIPELGV